MTPNPEHRSALSWFELPVADLDRAAAFYEHLLQTPLRREAMGPSQGAVFPYAGAGVGGALMCGPTAPEPARGGTLVYLDAGAHLDAALERALAAGAELALPPQDLPPGMGHFAHIRDLDGNRVGLHALAR